MNELCDVFYFVKTDKEKTMYLVRTTRGMFEKMSNNPGIEIYSWQVVSGETRMMEVIDESN